MDIGILGSTGLVGKKIISLLENRFPIKNLYTNREDVFDKQMDIVLLATPSHVSAQYHDKINARFVIDLSKEFRTDPNVPLVIPEINPHTITENTRLIANPNCSTSQLVMVLYPLHKKYHIKRVVVSTYQSVSGAGKKGTLQLKNEENNEIINSPSPFITQIHRNCIPCCDTMQDNGYTLEELKLVNETSKILGETIPLTATAVRVPVDGGHSESVNIEFEDDFDIDDVINLLQNTPGVHVSDYPTPFSVHHSENVFAGRIRRDLSQKRSLNLWIVADNLMKGAALNAVQIAELLYNKYYK
jgi:aspartate-semialdehyde dehydrogenase